VAFGHWVARCRVGHRRELRLPADGFLRVGLLSVTIGAGSTVSSVNPLLQWLVVPSIALVAARRVSNSTGAT